MERKNLFLIFLLVFTFAFMGLKVWTDYAEKQAHYTPEYEKVNIASILEKKYLSEEDYEILFLQTGLGRAGVDVLRGAGRQQELYGLQGRFFAETQIECLRSNLVVQSERVVSEDISEGMQAFLPTVETGDILISFNGHIYGWRCGHAAIVVDAGEGLTLEALTLGTDSEICSIERWREYPCFALLRLKGASQEERAEIANYAMENLVGIPYSLLVFGERAENRFLKKSSVEQDVGREKSLSMQDVEAEEPLAGTHCAHLVWQAFTEFGYDLDSDGGLIVTPRDLYESDLLEVVQVYGLNPKKLLIQP